MDAFANAEEAFVADALLEAYRWVCIRWVCIRRRCWVDKACIRTRTGRQIGDIAGRDEYVSHGGWVPCEARVRVKGSAVVFRLLYSKSWSHVKRLMFAFVSRGRAGTTTRGQSSGWSRRSRRCVRHSNAACRQPLTPGTPAVSHQAVSLLV